MTAEPSDSGEALPNGGPSPAKRGRGRPKGSVKKTKLNLFQRKLTRVPKVVELFSASTPKEPVRKRGRPRKHLSKTPKEPQKRGRPRKYPSTSETGPKAAVKRGRGRPLGSRKVQALATDGTPRKRGRPLGSKKKPAVEDGPPKKRGRPLGSGSRSGSVAAKKKPTEDGAPPRKRGRPRGSLGKKKRHWKAKIPEPKPAYDGPPRKRGRPSKVKPADLTSVSDEAEQKEIEQAATAAKGHDEILAPVEDEEDLQADDQENAAVAKETEEVPVSQSGSSGKKTPVTKRSGSSGRSRAV